MATAAFLKEARRSDAPLIPMVKVFLTSPSVKTLFLSTNFIEVETSGIFQLWEGAIVSVDPIRVDGSNLGTGLEPVTAGFTMATRAALGFQTAETDNISKLLKDYRWIGAKVELYLWSQTLTSFSDALLEYTGVIGNYRVDGDEVHFPLTQRGDWQRIISPTRVSRDVFPRAPDRSLGKALPIFYGAVKSLELHVPPWDAGYSRAVHDMEHSFGGQIGMQVIPVDSGRGGSGQRQEFLIAGHAIKSHNSPLTDLTTYFIRQGDVLVPIEIPAFAVAGCSTTINVATLTTSNDFLAAGVKIGMPLSGTNIPAGTTVLAIASATSLTMSANATATGSGITVTFTATLNGVAGAGFQLNDGFAGASWPLTPTGVPTGIAQPGDDLRYAIDPSDVSFARLTYQPSGPLIDKRRGIWSLPDIPTPGDLTTGINNVSLRFGYRSSAALTSFKVGIQKISPSSFQQVNLSPSTTLIGTSVSLGANDWGAGSMPVTPWAFSECQIVAYWDLAPAPGAREDVWIHFVGLEVVYAPRAKVWAPGYRIAPGRKYLPRVWLPVAGEPIRTVAPDTEIDADFYGTCEGYQDDGSGTYSGSASALIERPADIAHHLLRNYAGQSAAQVQTATSTFGSFVDARSAIGTWNSGQLKAGMQISDISDVETLLKDLARAGHAWVYLDRFTDKWHWIPWIKGGGTDYARKVWRDDIFSYHVEAMPNTRVPSAIRILYAYDAARREFTKSCYCSTGGSGAGHKYQDIRDEQDFKVVTGVNDKLDVATGAGLATVTLSGGSYADGHAMAKHVDGTMEATIAAQDFMVCYGAVVEAGYNDKLDFNDGAVKAATVAAATYATMEALATAVQNAMNAVSTDWECVYSRDTRKTRINRLSGTKTLLTATGANKATTAYTLLGYNSNADVTGGTVAQHFSEEEMFHVECLTSAMDLLFASGANGSTQAAPKNCAELLGFNAIYDRDAAGARRHWTSDSPRNTLEKTLADAADAYGQSRELVMELRSVYDTDTVRTIRNRVIDQLRNPPLTMRFTSYRMPDLRRGELLRFDDLDNFGIFYPKQGSDGLWAGKRFRVLKVQQRMGPSFEQEIECVEND